MVELEREECGSPAAQLKQPGAQRESEFALEEDMDFGYLY